MVALKRYPNNTYKYTHVSQYTINKVQIYIIYCNTLSTHLQSTEKQYQSHYSTLIQSSIS